MARKSIKGYAEKNYYDNLRFSGITASTDALNEGNFQHLVNFDIADTGGSLTPRKGYLTTAFEKRTIPADCIYFRDIRSNEYIFIYKDNTQEDEPLVAFCTDLQLEDKYFKVKNELTVKSSDISFSGLYKGVPYLDRSGARYYIIKLPTEWIKIYYNLNDTIEILKIDMSSIESLSDRNIASFDSIVPTTTSNILPDNYTDPIIQQFPLIYAHDEDGYVIDSYNDLTSLKLYPYFTIKDFKSDDKYSWGYIYEFVSTRYSTTNKIPDDALITYTSPLYSLSDEEIPSFLDKWYELISTNFLNNPSSTHYSSYTDLIQTYSEYYEENSKIFKRHLSDNDEADNVYIICLTHGGDYDITPSYDTPEAFINSFKKIEDLDLHTSVHLDNFFNALEIYKNENETVTKSGLLNLIKGLKDSISFDDLYFTVEPLSSFNLDPSLTTVVDSFMLQERINSSVYTHKGFHTSLEHLYNTLNKLPDACSFYFIKYHYTYRITPTSITTEHVATFNKWRSTYPIFSRVFTEGLQVQGQYNIHLDGSTTSLSDYFVSYTSTLDSTKHISYLPKARFLLDKLIFNFPRVQESSIVQKDDNFYIDLGQSHNLIKTLTNQGFFDNGVIFRMYLVPVTKFNEYKSSGWLYTWVDTYSPLALINSSSLFTTLNLVKTTSTPSYIVERLTEEPTEIRDAKDFTIFLQSHLVTWSEDTLYMSVSGEPGYFTYSQMYKIPGKIVKVLEFRDLLLVFTTTDVHALYPYESTKTVQTGVDENNEPVYAQQTFILYAQLPVMYNINANPKYASAIQVFNNNMVLFYAEEGQLYLIKPTATVDNNTRYSLQYLNKSVNDILLNYDQYINERLSLYNINPVYTKEDIQIYVHASLSYITIYYTIPDVFTYILLYDILNNRYTVYDTLEFLNIKDTLYSNAGDVLLSIYNNCLYLTYSYTNPFSTSSNVDLALYYNFRQAPILLELDTGILNLNNHLKKRFRTMSITYKNISARTIEYAIETFIDGIQCLTYLMPEVEEKNINDKLSYDITYIPTSVDLLNDNTALFNFTSINANKIITHTTSISSQGKHIRVRFIFKTQGKFKLQGFGLVYKEHYI